MNIFAHHSPFRIFGISGFITVAVLAAVLFGLGLSAALVTLVLVVVEVSFSFDNAIINAKVLARLSEKWQKLFLTAGIVVAVIGMRVVFPILIVALTAHLSWSNVTDLALHHPKEYAEKLELAHPSIAAFGGAFLLVLALQFFFDDNRKVFWIHRLERPMAKIGKFWVPGAITIALVLLLAAIPDNAHRINTLVAGLLGVGTYIVIQLILLPLENAQARTKASRAGLVGWAAVSTLLYLEVLDASFSFDGVIGAFAITNDVLLIAAGLGVGAIWVRSLTVFMVRRKTLDNYIYLEHGAHYTVGVLAILFFISLFVQVPDVVAGTLGLALIGASLLASKKTSTA